MEYRPGNKVEISQPKDKSLDAYKAWVIEIAKRLMKTELIMSEEEWIKSWKQYWSGKPRR